MRSFALYSIVTLSLSAFSALGQASIIFSENFDSVPDGTTKTGTIGNFTVTGGNVDVVGTFPTNKFNTLCVSSESGNCVDLNGNTPGTLTSSAISLVAGLYTLQFDLNGSQRGYSTSTTVSFASFTHTYVLTSSSTNVFSIPITVVTPGTSQIVFKSNLLGSASAGALLDDVQVSGTPRGGGGGTVPEPATALLTLGGFALAEVTRRRFSHKLR